MKRLIILAVIAAFTMTVWGQAPQKMSYQFVVRNSSGTLLANHAVGIKISILQGSATGTVIFAETYSPNPQTNANGLVSLEIGSGTALTGTFTGINWAQGPYFLKTETDLQGGTSYTISGTSQLLSVPYALYAKTAANGFSGAWADITGKPVFATVATSGSYNDLLNRPVLFSGAWADITGKPTTLAGYGITDADGSITNEIQSLSLSGTILSLSNGGGSVTLPSSGGGDNWGTQVVVTDATLAGNGTTATPLRIADNGVNSLKIQDGTIVTADLADQTVSTAKLGNLAVSADKIQNGAVTTDKLANGSVTGIKIAQGGAATGYVLKWNGTSWAPAEDKEGGLTLPYSGTGTSGGPLFNIVNLGTSGAISTLSAGNYGIWGESSNTTGIGVYGANKTSSGITYGVFGDVYSSSGFSGFFQGGKFYIQGSTGIGTQNPGAKLEVAGQIKITGGSPGSGKILTSDGTGLASWASPSVSWLNNGNDVYYNIGNVGVGLNNPSGRMEIYSFSSPTFPTLLLTDEGGYSRLSFRTKDASDKYWTLAGFTNDALSQFQLHYFDGTSGKNIITVLGDSRIIFNGDVGIGTNYPSAKLEVAGQVKVTGGTPGTGKVLTSDATGLASWQTPSSSPWLISGSNVYYNTGNVGIGTSVPNYKLTLYDASNPSLHFLNSGSGTGTGDGFLIQTLSSGNPVWIWNFENSNMHFATNNTNRMVIDADGHISMMRYLDLNTDGTFGALYVKGSQALWWDGTYFSWGYDATYNYFARKVTIGNPANPGYMLYVQGTAYATGTWSSSDARFKKNIATIDNPLEKLMKVRGARFEFRTDEFKDYQFAEGPQMGFIAQELENVFPEMVKTESNGYKSLNYSEMIPVLVEALKEQQKQIDELKKEIALLKSE